MDDLKDYIDQQINHNRSKNLFHPDLSGITSFSEETIKNIQKLEGLESGQVEMLIDYTTEKALREFCRINQYLAFGEKDRNDLRTIYQKLYKLICDKEQQIEDVAKNHYDNLRQWLENTNPFTQQMYPQKEAVLTPAVCSEYDAGLQLEILQIDSNRLLQPVLDIGCGRRGNLVSYLRNEGIEAYGIDRFTDDIAYIENVDWLEYDYGTDKWGTIISNLGFSNHFVHNHLRKDGNFIGYAKKYMDILRSLKVGGCFHYAPGLPFIEGYLDSKTYSVKKYRIDDLETGGTIIQRLE